MRQRRIYRRRTADYTKIKWGFVVALIFAFAGISYAAYTNVLIGNYSFTTGNMSFIFDNDHKQNVTVQLQNGSNGKVKELDATVSYDDKLLKISDIGPIDMTDLINGNAVFTIQYVLKAEKEEDGIRLPAPVESERDQGYDLGKVDFDRLTDTPVWSIKTGSKSWGTSSGDTNGTPDPIYRFMPDDLGEFHVYNTLSTDEEKGIAVGTVTMVQTSCPELPEDKVIGLKSLGLPEQTVNDIKSKSKGLKLVIEGSYGFTVPINLDQFNAER